MIRIVLVYFAAFVLLCATPICAEVYCIGECSNPRNLQYEEICCNQENFGNVIKIPGDEFRHKYILCPSTLSEGCKPPRNYSNCTEVLESDSSAESGYYNILSADGSVASVYCDMNGTNCDGQGGWTRIEYLDMTEPGATCPPGLTERQFDNINYPLCGRSAVGCQSTFYSTNTQSAYSKVCGRVRGYQFGRVFAFNEEATIQSFYVEGVSITRSNLPKQHIWTYAAGLNDNQATINDCPCNNGSTRSPHFVSGSDYYCESGPGETGLVVSDPLWDGEQCNGLEGPCCTNSKMPWFTKSLPGFYSDDIELRVCSSVGPPFGDIPIELIELYIK